MTYKLLRLIPCKFTVRVIDGMLNNWEFLLVMGSDISTPRKPKNGWRQGSLLAPLHFSFYIADMPETKSRKFGYNAGFFQKMQIIWRIRRNSHNGCRYNGKDFPQMRALTRSHKNRSFLRLQEENLLYSLKTELIHNKPPKYRWQNTNIQRASNKNRRKIEN